MRPDIAALLAEHDGVLTRREALATLPEHVVERAFEGPDLVRLLPRVYGRPEALHDPDTMARAALRYAGAGAVLSHLTALNRWGLRPAAGPVHISVPHTRRLRGTTSVHVHRRSDPRLLERRWRDGLPIVVLEQALLESWPLLAPADRRAPVIDAVRTRRTTAPRLLAALTLHPHLADRVALNHLLGLLDMGCHSELEIWGHLHVFRHPSLPAAAHQLRVDAGSLHCYLDVPYPEAMLDVELDGAAFHGSAADRERDLRRDAALAALGWHTVRYSHRRLHAEPDLVRSEVLTIYRSRRALLEGKRVPGWPAGLRRLTG